MLGEVSLEMSLLFGRCVIFLLFDLATSLCCLLVSPYVIMALWSQEAQHLVVQEWHCLHHVDPGAPQNGVEG